MQEEEILIPLHLKGSNETYYTNQQNLDKAQSIGRRNAVTILSPFDNSVIQRERLRNLFGFDYIIECYVPEPKRQYGYFTLPVLYGDTFAGRIDCKAERKDKILVVKNMFYEKKATAALKEDLGKALKKFAAFNGCVEVRGKV